MNFHEKVGSCTFLKKRSATRSKKKSDLKNNDTHRCSIFIIIFMLVSGTIE
jgi:hypothetical protein